MDNIKRCHPIPAAPPGAAGFLLWIHEYLSRLQSGVYRVKPVSLTEHTGSSIPLTEPRMISLFPRNPPRDEVPGIGEVMAVTRGVEIRASALYIPELTQYPHKSCIWAYSVSMRLLANHPSRPPALRTCQLLSRHWTIVMNGNPDVEEVDGEAVIGLYPLLDIGHAQGSSIVYNYHMPIEWPFEYQSCYKGEQAGGRMSGYLTFVPGSRDSPRGEPFRVEVPPFDFVIPNYIY